ncbi:myo-inositol-1(or 4)-monophosphatase [Loktanella fryxellensis]|uniref:Myo-inositol-1(Or 4)-monophosphatase n=1 Tax=Loktanella fryxellensis TaxID=245187 RepID=A0A1H8HTM1_9RHOB|nr:3'(2'),5'-bisphosphate nucleotidase CysQ [Loktanella fryxellensis]SEN59464.1 myo-inositol-1(or 4)-monophosphatase [Loktanella fryxellensis]
MPATDLTLLLSAAQAAGDVAMRHFKTDPQVWDKADDQGPVTEADFAVNALLADRLRSARPAYGWLSEESPDDGARLGTQRQFVVDPIDGTRAFIAHSLDWAIALAVIEDRRVIAGVVTLPARGLTYAAAYGQGATLNGQLLCVTQTRDPATAQVLTTRPNLAARHWQGGAPPAFATAFRSSLAYRMCLVAEGRYDAMLTLRPSWEWDIAAGALIVTEAGGHATDRTGADLLFNAAHPQVNGVIAGGGVHPALRAALS